MKRNIEINILARLHIVFRSVVTQAYINETYQKQKLSYHTEIKYTLNKVSWYNLVFN